MLEPWIIEEIRRKEQEERDRQYQPLELELPLPSDEEPLGPPPDEVSPQPRGVIVIDLL